MFSLGLGGGIISEVILVALIALVLYIIFKLGKLIIGIIVNTIVGLIAIFLLDYFFHIGIPIAWVTIIPTALFGLPAVAVLVILRLFGIPL